MNAAMKMLPRARVRSGRKQRGGNRQDLQPVRLDERAARSDPERERSQNAGGYAPYEAVADLLQHEVHRRVGSQGPVVPLGDRERDEEERDADSVVEATLDVETLPDPRRDPLVGDDRLAKRCVRAGEHDRQHQRLDQADAG